MLLFLLFASAAAQCETSTCAVCKNMTGCDWYGFDCVNKTSKAVTSLGLDATAVCPMCQAGSCSDCQAQVGCSWYTNKIPGAPGKCSTTNSTDTLIVGLYDQLDICPTCQNHATCNECSQYNATCGWYELPGGLSGKCREAAPTFAYSKVKLGFCGGDPCGRQVSCTKCNQQAVGNETICSWYTSNHPNWYGSKCDDATGGVLSNNLYTKTATTCPICAGTSCSDCKAESGCRWVAVDLGLGSVFGQCINSTTTVPTGKTEVTTCPNACDLHSCTECRANSACTWYTAGGALDDVCDFTTDAYQHPFQTAATTCPACAADRCYECDSLSGCGWYAKTLLGQIYQEGCFSTSAPPSGRTLIAKTDSKCKGRPNSSAHVVVSFGLMALLALVA